MLFAAAILLCTLGTLRADEASRIPDSQKHEEKAPASGSRTTPASEHKQAPRR
jgi:hypothetical protein